MGELHSLDISDPVLQRRHFFRRYAATGPDLHSTGQAYLGSRCFGTRADGLFGLAANTSDPGRLLLSRHYPVEEVGPLGSYHGDS